VAVVVTLVMVGLATTGYDAETWGDAGIPFSQKLSITIGQASAYIALLWGSFGGLLTAVGLTLLTRRMVIHDVVESILKGFKTMLGAVVILILAWVLAGLTEQLETAHFLTGQLLSANLALWRSVPAPAGAPWPFCFHWSSPPHGNYPSSRVCRMTKR
jgi:Na+/H+ antiporter NhaC